MMPINPTWQSIKEWIPEDEPDFDGFNRPRKPMNLTLTDPIKARHG